MIGRLREPTVNRDGTMNLIIAVDCDCSEMYEELKSSDVDVEIKKHSRRRSLDANAFAWVLIDKIAEKTGEKVIDVYRNAIRDVGGVSEILGMKTIAVPSFKRCWEYGHLGRQVEIIPGSAKEGWSNVKVWYGSSEFDSAQMQRLLDSLIQDAEALGIPTISDKQADEMLGKWKPKVWRE